MHVLTAWVARINATRLGRRVPLINDRVELHARIGTLPSRLSKLAIQLACLQSLSHFSSRHFSQMPVGVIDYSLHKLVGNPDRDIGILILNTKGIFAIKAHVPSQCL